MSDRTGYAFLVARWQQQAEEELLLEIEWIAAQMAARVEQDARDAMDAQRPPAQEETP